MALNLKKIRIEHNLTQRQLADKVGLEQSQISNLETGRRLGSVTIWDRLEKVLNVDQRTLRQVETPDNTL
jgi:transcriptional regulator with XRE-family HTH domain